MTDIVDRLSACHGRKSGDPDCYCEEAQDEIEWLRALKTPASRELLNITKALLDDANADNERLRQQLRAVLKHVEDLRARPKP